MPGLLLYKEELAEWQKRGDIKIVVTVDQGDKDWKGKVGLVPNVLEEVAPSSENTYAVICGPPDHDQVHLPQADGPSIPQ